MTVFGNETSFNHTTSRFNVVHALPSIQFICWMGLLVLILGLGVSNNVQASTLAAKVILAKGTVTATGPEGERALSRRSDVFVGDHIKTGPGAIVQLRFIDKARMTLRENTEFAVETYSLKGPGKSNKVLMRLVTGGFRTITGSIGKGSKDAYEVATSAASIGIRGTHYEVVEESPNVFVMAVWEGGIRVTNKQASLDLGADVQYSYSRVEKGKAPVGLLMPPPSITPPQPGEVENRLRRARAGKVAQTPPGVMPHKTFQDAQKSLNTTPNGPAAEAAVANAPLKTFQ